MTAIAIDSAPALWLAWAALVAAARVLRSTTFAIASAVIVGLMLMIIAGLARNAADTTVALLYGFSWITLIHFATLLRPRLRPLWFRALINIPGLAFLGGTLLAFPWAVASAVGAEPALLWMPFALSAFGVKQSLSSTATEVDLLVDDAEVDGLQRYRSDIQASAQGQTVSLVQITDPHLGPFMSVARLRQICERAVAADPDLVVLTGDLVTMESHADPGALGRALQPLAALKGRVFACMGNHDYEAPETVYTALEQIGATLLVDEMARVHTAAGPIEIVGADYYFRNRQQRVEALLQGLGDRGQAVRILLLHNPAHFRFVPSGSIDLALSGHTHGGQLGLVSLGLRWTLWNALAKSPDHGPWAHGRNRLYVHRGTGHYGFPVRIGVPREESVLRVTFSRTSGASS